MPTTYKGFNLLCIPLLTLLILITGCEDPGSVGGDFVDKPELTLDTLSISNIQNVEFRGYTGLLNHVSMGKYSDPVFGEIDAIAMFKPTLEASLPSGEILDVDYYMQLQLVLDNSNSYGDTLSEASYSIYEITSNWNGETHKYDSEVSYDESNLVGSFTLSNNVDTVMIDLSNQWKNSFAEYYNSDADSAYRFDFHGLALVANSETNNIIHPNIADSRFLAINNSLPDTTNFSIREWAFTLNRTGEIVEENSSAIHSTLEGMMKLDISEYLDSFAGENFIRAEIVLYEAEEMWGGLPENHTRTNIPLIGLDVGYDEDAAYEFQFEPYDAAGAEEEHTYRINITEYVNNTVYGSEDRQDLYIGIGLNNGMVQSTLIYNHLAPEGYQPKLVITSLSEGVQE